MPPPLSRAELRLGSFCRLYGALTLAGAALFAFAPGLSYRIASFGGDAALGPEALFWNALGASSMVAVAVAAFVVARDPRGLRHALLPVVAAKGTASALGFAHFGAGRALAVLACADLPLFVLTLLAYRSSSPGVHGIRPGLPGPAEPDEGAQPKVQLGVPK